MNVNWLKTQPPQRSCGGRDVSIIGRARLAGAALGGRSLRFRVRGFDRFGTADGGRQRVERDAFEIAARTVGDVFAIAVAGIAGTARAAFSRLRALGAFRAVVAVVAFRALSAFRPLSAFRALEAVARFPRLRTIALVAFVAVRPVVALGAVVVAALVALIVGFHLLVVTLVIVAVAALAALLFEAGAAFAEDAVIVIRILQIIFGLDAVAAELRVARHALVLFQQLRGIATLAIVLTVAVRPSTEILGPLAPAAATATTLSIIDQMLLPSK
jgi:hypothetical protein